MVEKKMIILVDVSSVIITNAVPEVAVKLSESLITTTLGKYPTKSYTLENYGLCMNAISKGNYGSCGCGRAVFDSTYEEDLFDVIVVLKIWNF